MGTDSALLLYCKFYRGSPTPGVTLYYSGNTLLLNIRIESAVSSRRHSMPLGLWWLLTSSSAGASSSLLRAPEEAVGQPCAHSGAKRAAHGLIQIFLGFAHRFGGLLAIREQCRDRRAERVGEAHQRVRRTVPQILAQLSVFAKECVDDAMRAGLGLHKGVSLNS